MKKLAWPALFAVAAACASTGAPDQLPEGAEALRPVPSVFSLIGDREELELTSVQITALDSIGEWIARNNSPLLEQLADLGVGEAAAGRSRRSIPDEARPLLDQVQANNERATSGVGEILTAEQKSAVCRGRPETIRERRDAARNQSSARDSLQLIRRARWEWCPEANSEA